MRVPELKPMRVPDLNWKANVFQDDPDAVTEANSPVRFTRLSHTARGHMRSRQVWARQHAGESNIAYLFGLGALPHASVR